MTERTSVYTGVIVTQRFHFDTRERIGTPFFHEICFSLQLVGVDMLGLVKFAF